MHSPPLSEKKITNVSFSKSRVFSVFKTLPIFSSILSTMRKVTRRVLPLASDAVPYRNTILMPIGISSAFAFFLILGEFVFLRLNWGVYRVVPKVDKERLVFVFLNKRDSTVCEGVGQIITFLSILQSRNICAWVPFTLIGKIVGAGLPHPESAILRSNPCFSGK